MKLKSKSILKKLGVGALACCSLFGLSGCTPNLISNDQDKLMEEILEILDNKSKEVNKDYLYELLILSENKLITNYNDVQNNLKVTIVDTSPEYGDLTAEYYFYSTDDKRVFLHKEDNDVGGGKEIELVYTGNEVTYVYEAGEGYDEMNDDYNREEKTIEDLYFDNYLAQSGYTSVFSIFSSNFGVTKDSISDYQKDKNGNLKITLSTTHRSEDPEHPEKYWYEYLRVIEYTITSTGFVKSITLNQVCVDASEDSYERHVGSIDKFSVSYEYGTVSESDIEHYLNKALICPAE